MPTPTADAQLVQTLESLGVDASWEATHRLGIATRVLLGESVDAVAKRTRHRSSSVVKWVAQYQAAGAEAFLPRLPAGTPPRGATLQGMLSGRLVEEAWLSVTRRALPAGLVLDDARDQDPDPGWDYEVRSAAGAATGFTIDVKLHGAVFREAERYTGLQPDDCIPLGIYKMLVSRQRQRRGGSHHLYAFMFRPDLDRDLMAQLRVLPSAERQALEVLFTTTAKQRKRQQRLAVATVVGRHFGLLEPLLRGFEFRVISTTRAERLFLEEIETRAPMLRGQGQTFGSTINMHYSWSREMTAWSAVLGRLSTDSSRVLADFAQGRI